MHINNTFLYKSYDSFDFFLLLKSFLNKHDSNVDDDSQMKMF